MLTIDLFKVWGNFIGRKQSRTNQQSRSIFVVCVGGKIFRYIFFSLSLKLFRCHLKKKLRLRVSVSPNLRKMVGKNLHINCIKSSYFVWNLFMIFKNFSFFTPLRGVIEKLTTNKFLLFYFFFSCLNKSFQFLSFLISSLSYFTLFVCH
jgi:hypothetical protein